MKKSLLIFILFLFTTTTSATPDWLSVERLIKEKKLTQVTLQIDNILKQAKKNKNNKNWQQALILGAVFRSASGQPENSLNFLNQPWPQDDESKMLINLHKAYLLKSYIQMYRWEIQKREKITSKKLVPLKKKTMKQLVKELNQAFTKAYILAKKQKNTSLDHYALPVPEIKNYFIKSNYPAQVRGNIYDTVTYLWVDFLQDSSLWSPSELAQANTFTLEELLSVSYRDKFGLSSGTNPKKRQLWLLSDLEHDQVSQRRPEAAMEAFRVKVNKLSIGMNKPKDLKLLISSLKQYIKRNEVENKRSLPWSNMLRDKLAELIRETKTDDANIKRLVVLKDCVARHKKQNATTFCRDQMNQIINPYIQLSAMKVDGLKKRSLEITHANVNKLYFRAWHIDKPNLLDEDPYHFIASLEKENKKPNIQWQTNIVDKKDYKPHKTYITPPLKKYGNWVIVASKDDHNFSFDSATMLNLSPLIADIQTGGTSDNKENIINVTVYDGEKGHVINKANIELWINEYNKPEKLIASAISTPKGKAHFKIKKSAQYKLIIKYNQQTSIIRPVNSYPVDYETPIKKSALTFTDRAIYRPSQKILWKVVAYQGNSKTGKFNVFANSTGWVKLFDANNKLVKQTNIKTNSYGSSSGEFTAKTGRLLGFWRIETSWGGSQHIKVEEYKRPTFSIKLKPSKKELALDKPAEITGIAKYYFGQSITDGRVSWQVKRDSVRFWSYGRIYPETIATGDSNVDKNGNFSIKFLPKSLSSKQLGQQTEIPKQYRFTITADFTDSGGETRSVTHSFEIGKVGIEASILTQQAFGIAGKPYTLDINRHDTNRTARAGNAYWEVFRIAQPNQTKMPADLTPANTRNIKSKFSSKGDLINPRWAAMKSPFNILQDIEHLTQNWKDGDKIQQGTLKHDKSGNADILLNNLGAGLYRLRYTTKDRWGQVYKTDKTFVISFQDKNTIRIPIVLEVQNNTVEVGDKITYLAGSGFNQSPVLLEIYHNNKLIKQSIQHGGIKQLEFPVTHKHQGGLSFVLTMVKDYQLIRKKEFVSVPWTDRKLNVSFSTFRDKLQPGQKEKWRISVKNADNKPLEKGAVEVLASMYDRSLDLFSNHTPSNILSLYKESVFRLNQQTNLGFNAPLYTKNYELPRFAKNYQDASLSLINQHQLFSRGEMNGGIMQAFSMMPTRAPRASVDVYTLQKKLKAGPRNSESDTTTQQGNNEASLFDSINTRTNFNETAFFYPHLILDDDGTVAFEFEVPESLTEWKVWVSAITRDLHTGSLTSFAKTSKELMIRPYLPRFLRAGDHAYIEVLVNNMSKKSLTGKLDFDILDATTLKSIASSFKLNNSIRDFTVAAGKSSRLRFSIIAPKELGMVAIRARASAGTLGDGEQRPIPILPSRIHLTQSRFAALQGNMSKTLQFKELAQNDDPSHINDKLVVTVDGQLFYSTLNALPYLVQYPYECTEQTMNRFLSTSIVNSVFKDHPAIASMASKLAKRDSQFEKWEKIDKDPNRKMLLEETPWLNDAQGGKKSIDNLIRILDPNIANMQSQKALLKLSKAQTVSGGFPWWDGGKESVYMTAYLLHGFSRALEFNVDVPKDVVQKAWVYLNNEYKKYNKDAKKLEANFYNITLTNYVLSSYPDESWTGGVFSKKDQEVMLEVSFKNWKKLPSLLKAYLSLTLKRAGRIQDANLIFDSLMDSAKTDKDLGTYWAPEDRSWLWYNDSIDTHAFMLRAMMELNPADKRRHGLVQWLMLNKKLNHWKSTRATAESIYSLVHYLKKENQLGQEERALIKIGNLLDKTIVFKPTEYTGKAQLVVEGDDIKPAMSKITVDNQGKALMFASATWHFSTEKLPKSAHGDFFQVTRKFFKRVQKDKQWTLQPLQEGAQIKIGDQLEVQLSLRAKHAAEFIHLRAPRGAGFEPMSQSSGYRWDIGIAYYEEIRDSGANYFFEQLPAGEYSFKYNLRATTAGEFRVAPASVQSIYAPEFNAYSSGKRLTIH